MLRRTILMIMATMVVAVLVASGIALLLAEKPAQAAFPGENGKIAFERNGNIFSMNPDGSEVKRLTDTPAADSAPEYSASGKKIAFTRGRSIYGEEIYTMKSDGSKLRRLTDNDTSDREPAWSPDGKEIVFTRVNRVRGVPEIYKINADGSEARRIVKGGCLPPSEGCSDDREDYGEEYYTPDWSPDGKKIALGGAKVLPCGADRVKSIYTVNPDGSSLRRVTNRGRACDVADYAPDWSPDAEKIVFYSFGLLGGILTVNADGSGQKKLYSHTSFDEEQSYDPAWSPNGKRIAFERTGTNYESGGVVVKTVQDIYTINASDGSERRRITDDLWTEFDLDWQPR